MARLHLSKKCLHMSVRLTQLKLKRVELTQIKSIALILDWFADCFNDDSFTNDAVEIPEFIPPCHEVGSSMSCCDGSFFNESLNDE